MRNTLVTFKERCAAGSRTDVRCAQRSEDRICLVARLSSGSPYAIEINGQAATQRIKDSANAVSSNVFMSVQFLFGFPTDWSSLLNSLSKYRWTSKHLGPPKHNISWIEFGEEMDFFTKNGIENAARLQHEVIVDVVITHQLSRLIECGQWICSLTRTQ
jgi:hypothetical protein